MSKPLIVFRLKYIHTMGWGAISNFITKFSEKKPMKLSDVVIASSIVLKGKRSDQNFPLLKEIVRYNEQFKRIRRPENIFMGRESLSMSFFC